MIHESTRVPYARSGGTHDEMQNTMPYDHQQAQSLLLACSFSLRESAKGKYNIGEKLWTFLLLAMTASRWAKHHKRNTFLLLYSVVDVYPLHENRIIAKMSR